MKNLTVLLIFTFLFCSQIGYGQINSELIFKISGKYYYQGQVYQNEEDLKDIYKTNPEAYKAFNRFMEVRRVHRTLTAVSGIALSAAIGAAIINNDPCEPSEDCNNYVPSNEILIGLVLIGTTLITVGTAIPVNKRRGKARKIFNEGVLSTSKVGSIPPSLNFQTSQNGIGLVFNF